MKKIESITEVKVGDILTYCAAETHVEFKIQKIVPPSIFLLDKKFQNLLKIVISEMLISDAWYVNNDLNNNTQSVISPLHIKRISQRRTGHIANYQIF